VRRLPSLLSLVVLFTAQAAPSFALNLIPIRSYDGTVADGQFGAAAVVVGDMDGDGLAEFAVAANYDTTTGGSAGRVFIFRGGSHVGDPPVWHIDGLAGEFLGSALAPAGDQDGDGLADLLIGAPSGSDATPNAPGRVILFYGSNPIGTRTPLVLTGDDPDDRFGSSLAFLGNFDGDTKPDFAVGAPGASIEQGYVRVFHGGVTPPTPIFTVHGEDYGEDFGYSIAGVGKTRGPSSTNDLLVGAPFSSLVDIDAGKAYLYFGGSPPDTFPDQTWVGGAEQEFATAVAGVGDINGDGRTDWVIGAPVVKIQTMQAAGKAFVYLGASPPPSASSTAILGTVAKGYLGEVISGLGDVNADGKPDFAVAAPGTFDSDSVGQVRIFLGKASPNGTADQVLRGGAVGDGFGTAVSNGGRVISGTKDVFLIGMQDYGTSGRAVLFGEGFPVGVDPIGPVTGLDAMLASPWPNPARSSVRCAVVLGRESDLRLEVVDVTGRTARSLANRVYPAGRHEFSIATGGLGPGLYWVVLESSGHRESRAFVLLGE
jgi:hypothetical protein